MSFRGAHRGRPRRAGRRRRGRVSCRRRHGLASCRDSGSDTRAVDADRHHRHRRLGGSAPDERPIRAPTTTAGPSRTMRARRRPIRPRPRLRRPTPTPADTTTTDPAATRPRRRPARPTRARGHEHGGAGRAARRRPIRPQPTRPRPIRRRPTQLRARRRPAATTSTATSTDATATRRRRRLHPEHPPPDVDGASPPCRDDGTPAPRRLRLPHRRRGASRPITIAVRRRLPPPRARATSSRCRSRRPRRAPPPAVARRPPPVVDGVGTAARLEAPPTAAAAVQLVSPTSVPSPPVSTSVTRKPSVPRRRRLGRAEHGVGRLAARHRPVTEADYVKIVSPSAGGRRRHRRRRAAGMASSARRRSLRLRTRILHAPHSEARAAAVGAARGFVVAALVGLLVLMLFNFTSRVASLVEAPLAYRRALSLECPG